MSFLDETAKITGRWSYFPGSTVFRGRWHGPLVLYTAAHVHELFVRNPQVTDLLFFFSFLVFMFVYFERG